MSGRTVYTGMWEAGGVLVWTNEGIPFSEDKTSQVIYATNSKCSKSPKKIIAPTYINYSEVTFTPNL